MDGMGRVINWLPNHKVPGTSQHEILIDSMDILILQKLGNWEVCSDFEKTPAQKPSKSIFELQDV